MVEQVSTTSFADLEAVFLSFQFNAHTYITHHTSDVKPVRAQFKYSGMCGCIQFNQQKPNLQSPTKLIPFLSENSEPA